MGARAAFYDHNPRNWRLCNLEIFKLFVFLNLLCYIGLDFLVFFFLFWRGRGVP